MLKLEWKSILPCCALLLAGSWANAADLIFLKSEPGDFVGGGQQLILTPQEVDITANRNFNNGISVSANNFSRPNTVQNIFFNFDFAAPFGVQLQPGPFENAARFPFQDQAVPGLSITGNGRGCNTVTGRFDVLEIEMDAFTGQILKFAVDFEQHCDGQQPALFGSLRFRSNVPPSMLLPPRIVLDTARNPQGCVEATSARGGRANLRATTVTPGNFDFAWSTSSGMRATGSEFSPLIAVKETAAVTLTLTDRDTGKQVSVNTQICSSDTTAPVVQIVRPFDGDVLPRSNRNLTVRVTDVVDGSIKTFNVFVGHREDFPLNPRGGTTVPLPPRGANMGDGVVDTQIIVTARDASGNQGQQSIRVMIGTDDAAALSALGSP